MVGRLALEEFQGAFFATVGIGGSLAVLETLDFENPFAVELCKFFL
jgi:hypothetical protein